LNLGIFKTHLNADCGFLGVYWLGVYC
jgi:hypothetical protein